MGNSLGKVKKGTTHREATNWNRVIALRERAASALLSSEGLRCCEDGKNLSGGYRVPICRIAPTLANILASRDESEPFGSCDHCGYGRPSTYRYCILQKSNHDVRHVMAEAFANMMTGESSRNRSESAQQCSPEMGRAGVGQPYEFGFIR